MTADFEFSVKLQGSEQEISAILEVLRAYDAGKDDVSISFITLERDGKEHTLGISPEDELEELLKAGDTPIYISASGPYGRYCSVSEVRIFEDMADAAPGASFEGSITGGTSYTNESVQCRLENGLLHVTTRFESIEDSCDEYLEYYKENMSYEDFINLFDMEPEEFDGEAFEDFIQDVLIGDETDLCELSYEDFIFIVEGESGLDEESFEEAKAQYEELGIMDYFTFMSEEGFGECEKYCYDPVNKCVVKDGAAAVVPAVAAEEPAAEEVAEEVAEEIAEEPAAEEVAEVPAVEEPATEEVVEEPAVEEPAAEEPAAEEVAAEEPAEEPAPECCCAECDAAAETSAEEKASPADSAAAKGGKAWIAWLIVAIAAAAFLAAYIGFEPVMTAVNGFINGVLGIGQS